MPLLGTDTYKLLSTSMQNFILETEYLSFTCRSFNETKFDRLSAATGI